MLTGTLNDWLEREWLLTNGRGGYAGSTIIGCPTRRYHGWLIWNRPGVLNRWVLWSHAAEHVVVGGRTYLLSNFEFNNAIDPHGYQHIRSFDVSASESHPSVEWCYQLGAVAVRKTLWLERGRDRVSVRYDCQSKDDSAIRLQLWPLIACREADDLRRKFAGQLFETTARPHGFALVNRLERDVAFAVAVHAEPEQAGAEFLARPDWWYNFRYRQEAARGYDCGEDLFVPGSFLAQSAGRLCVQLSAEAGTGDVDRLACESQSWAPPEMETTVWAADPAVLLSAAAQQCVIQQPDHDGGSHPVIVAGYPWLESYSRDACVALPGLLLHDGGAELARGVLKHMAGLLRDGLLPNHVVDDAADYEYTAADEPLWFIYAVDAFLHAAPADHGDAAALMTACHGILDAYGRGTRRDFDDGRCCAIALDPADGLVKCGGDQTACTWMDARFGGRWLTPRNGKPIEINALWYNALRSMSARLASGDPAAARRYADWAQRAGASIEAKFWGQQQGYLADVLTDEGPDWSLRPNQLLAVGLPHSPLHAARAGQVLDVVTTRLLTPVGLRTLAPEDPSYRGRYEGGPEQREAAAHQGSVYPWLMGFYAAAHLRVHGDSALSRSAARATLLPLLDHVRRDAALGGVSGVFDGDAPHAPRACIQQAWSAAELLRAFHMTEPATASAPGSMAGAAEPRVGVAAARRTRGP
jgi:predicted glycogen debranching enzyme